MILEHLPQTTGGHGGPPLQSFRVCDVDKDKIPDIVTGAGIGAQPHVKIFRAIDLLVLHDFLAYEPDFVGGVFVAGAPASADRYTFGLPAVAKYSNSRLHAADPTRTIAHVSTTKEDQ